LDLGDPPLTLSDLVFDWTPGFFRRVSKRVFFLSRRAPATTVERILRV
jgi:hypothetical protein